jgi:hypothetical protein
VRRIAVHPPAESRRDAHEQTHHNDRHPQRKRFDHEPRRQQLYDGSDLAQLPNVVRQTETGEQRRRGAERLKGWEDDVRSLATPRV